MPLFPTPTIYEDPESPNLTFPDAIINVRPSVEGSELLSVVLCIIEDLRRNPDLDASKLIPVMIVDPQRSHSNEGRDSDGPQQLMREARALGIQLVETDIPNTQTNFARFLATHLCLHPHQHQPSLPSA